MNKIHDFFKKHHIDEKDIPKAFIMYKSLSLLACIGFFSLTYRYRPIQKMIHIYPINLLNNNLRNNFPNYYKKTIEFIDNKSKLISENKYFKPIPLFFNLQPQRTTLAIG